MYGEKSSAVILYFRGEIDKERRKLCQGNGVYFSANPKAMLYSVIRVPWEGNDGKDKYAGFSAGSGFS
jgi:hypothetical protein